MLVLGGGRFLERGTPVRPHGGPRGVGVSYQRGTRTPVSLRGLARHRGGEGLHPKPSLELSSGSMTSGVLQEAPNHLHSNPERERERENASSLICKHDHYRGTVGSGKCGVGQ